MTSTDLRVGVVGAGLMGADHIARITKRISGAVVSAVIEPDEGRGTAALQNAPGAQWFTSIEDAIAANAVDAVVIATPGKFHEPVLLPALAAKLPILCEKPLTADSASSLRVVEAEMAASDRPLIQLGFMRRFDAEYARLREIIASGEAGELLALRAVHRNPDVPETYTQDMLINDSVVHELDVIPWLAGSEIRSIEIKYMRRNPNSPERLREPILVLLELENGILVDVEMNVSIKFGYQVATEAVFSNGLARIGQANGLQIWSDGAFAKEEHRSFVTRFAAAYDVQIQRWVDAVARGTIDGPDAFHGYRVALACEAGVQAFDGGIVEVQQAERPAFYDKA